MQEQDAQATQPTDPMLEWFLSHCHIKKYAAKSILINAGEEADNVSITSLAVRFPSW